MAMISSEEHREVALAFYERRVKDHSNLTSDGSNLFLYGNRIAWWDDEGSLWITSAGWFTMSTRNGLSLIPNISVCQKKHIWYLNGQVWDGDAIKITEENKNETA
jgi:hypothetical protein